ncbi:MAG TPA: hypothetical protein VFV38_43880 [Ktedonobacteraceae bacterium]|nr:hypothetical protein [Ktedonobacteraceae bacterium]
MFQPEISVGDLLTATSIIVSITALLIAWSKDRQLKKKAEADRIRRAAGTITAKVERWVVLGLRFFDDAQPIITDADGLLLKEKDFIQTRDFLWRNMVAIHATSLQRIVDEQIEMAYADLYGYDPRIQELFVAVVEKLKQIDQNIFDRTLNLTQKGVLQLASEKKLVHSAQLGNILRLVCRGLASQYQASANEIVASFRKEMIKLIKACDDEIIHKHVQILSPRKVLPSSLQMIKFHTSPEIHISAEANQKTELLPEVDEDGNYLYYCNSGHTFAIDESLFNTSQ